MGKADQALSHIGMLEELAAKDTPLHRRHPVAHLAVTLFYILTVTSFGKYAVSAMLPLVFYPLFVFSYGEIPLRAVLGRLLAALPFVLFVGILNPLLDPVRVTVMHITLSAGWISLLSLLLRGCLTVTAALLMIALTGMKGLAHALRTLHVPRIIIMQLLMTFRYIHVLTQEAGRMMLAHRLRAPGQRGIAPRLWGPMIGQWLLRTLSRAERIHEAMLCRGYSGIMPSGTLPAFGWMDAAYILGCTAFFVLVRLVDLPQWLGNLFLTWGK